DQRESLRRAPAERMAAQAGEQDQGGQRDGEQARPRQVDRRMAPRARRGEAPADNRDGENTERQVDVEDPTPAQMLDEEAADQDQRESLRRAPAERMAAQAGEQDQGGQRDGEQARPRQVDRRMAPRARRGEAPADNRDGENTERQVDVEDPTPAQMLDEEAAD